MSPVIIVLLTIVGVGSIAWHWQETARVPAVLGLAALVAAGCIAVATDAAAGLVLWAAAALVAIPATAFARAFARRSRQGRE